ncbi:MAG TPA: hypothetical protein VF701_07120 [Thermoanaerobaculia bacterium]
MMIHFTVEERHLADSEGRPVVQPDAVTFHSFAAESVDEAVRLYIRRDEAEVIGNVLKFPGFQAVATVRKPGGVYTLQFTPASHG